MTDDLNLPDPWRAVTDPVERAALEQAVAPFTEPRRLLHGHRMEVVATNDDGALLLRLDNGWLAQADRRDPAGWRVRAMFETATAWRGAWQEQRRLDEQNSRWRVGTPEVRAEIKRRLVALIAKHCAARPGRIGEQTRLWHDLHIYGDDVDDLFAAIQAEFGILFDVHDDARYFPGAGQRFNAFFSRLLGRKAPDYRPVTLGHLIAVVERGQWFRPGAP